MIRRARRESVAPSEVDLAMLAVALTVEALAPAHALGLASCRAEVLESIRPTPTVTHVLRELDALGVPVMLVAELPADVLVYAAHALWLRGDVVGGPNAIERVPQATGLPAPCNWLVTPRASEAARAVALGMKAIAIASPVDPPVDDSAADAFLRAPDIAGALEHLRAPYTRAALALRYLARTLVRPTPDEAAS